MTRCGLVLMISLGLGFAAGVLDRAGSEGGSALDRAMQGDENAFTAARLELMVLRASLPEAHRVRNTLVSIAPGSNAITVDQAAQALVRMPKPVTCTASVRTGGMLLIECKPITGMEESGLHNSVVRGLDHEFRSDPAALSDERRILLVCGVGERLKLSLAAFRRWYQDYLQPFSVALTGDQPTAAEQPDAEEVEHVIRLRHVDPVDPEDIPPELRFPRP
jgi:hypothetical protein